MATYTYIHTYVHVTVLTVLFTRKPVSDTKKITLIMYVNVIVLKNYLTPKNKSINQRFQSY